MESLSIEEWPCESPPSHEVDRWDGTHTDGPLSTFIRQVNKRGSFLIQTDAHAAEESARKSLGGEFVMFGKHKGKKWDDVPDGYLRWILGTFEDNKKSRRVRKTARLLLKRTK